MKKTLIMIFALIVLGMPFVVNANIGASVPKGECTYVEVGDNKFEQTCPVYVTTDAGESVEEATFNFTYNTSAITSFECEDAGDDFEVKDVTGAAGNYTCKFGVIEGDGVTGAKLQVGQIKYVVDKNASDEDCTVSYTFNGSSGKINPETGSFVPYVVIGSGILLVGAILLVTKKSRLYRI